MDSFTDCGARPCPKDNAPRTRRLRVERQFAVGTFFPALGKSDIGAVRLRLADPSAVEAAYSEIAAATGRPEPVVLVQPMAAGQVELVAGIVHDKLFGSLVMAGLGGVHTELFADRTFSLVPMTDRDASRMWHSLRASALLT